ncbi:hypothetical protein SARC_06304 [Sphaeroforma arctica JP610]|uniref:Uncharacterized protein n=1 Tax=Sphaeroforma arctica JP610 TaxID=667725 RepID=A0A0L0FXK7_9EUKA|nr:hypothetical protein SARC_06304 [Sphaeroforma arctica JP610]KNC81379.1 hypothetical protein SARC_06304 [Sphaeroforma arctica JP610]|eukprot:XP_014155281.1 hypothetical protein SARC_06304 [Sphaeroforma arctica JP610]
MSQTMHDTWRTMSSSDLESGYLANVFSEMAECTQSLELDVAKSNIKAEREYRERLSFLLAYVETAICYVEYLDDIDETLAHWANQVHNIQRSIGECDQSARTLTDKGGANKTEKELCSLQKKLRMASESEAEVGLLMDRLRSASGKELSYYELVKEEDLKVAHYQRTKALATACDKKLHAYQNVIKILQYPVQIREPAYNLVADSKQAQCGEHSI